VADGLIDVEDGIRLRPVEAADRDFLRRLYASTRADELALVQWTGTEKAAFIEHQFAAQDRYYREVYADDRFTVVELNGRPVGRWYVAELDSELRLVEVTIQPHDRGRGIGTQLVAALCAEADERGVPIRLHVEPWNPARRLYERFGFVPVGEPGAVYQPMERAPR
jgi:ribosomal protein S18 acetylase RimI-like enzyme